MANGGIARALMDDRHSTIELATRATLDAIQAVIDVVEPSENARAVLLCVAAVVIERDPLDGWSRCSERAAMPRPEGAGGAMIRLGAPMIALLVVERSMRWR